jgi:site-specific DNA recombinase
MVLVYDLSRFARNNSDAVHYTDLLKDANIELISITQEFGSTNEGMLIAGIMNLLNEYYSRNNSKITHAAMKVKANQAIHCGGVPPLGYDVGDDGRLIVNDREAEVVRMIFAMVEQNYSYRRIAEILNEQGYCSKSGKQFNKNSFISILRQEKYVGTYIWDKERRKNSKGKRNSHAFKLLDEQVRIQDGCPSIISLEQFQRVQDLLSNRKNGVAASKARRHYMLSGLKVLKCAECGSYLIGAMRQSLGSKYAVYYCPKHKQHECNMREISADHLNKMVARILANDFAHRQDFAEITSQLRKENPTAFLQEKLQSLEKESKSILKIATKCSDETLIQKLKALSAEKENVKRAIANNQLCVNDVNEGNVISVSKKLAKTLMESDDLSVKQYLMKHIKEILVDNETVKINMVEY